MPVMNEMQPLLASEPGKAAKPAPRNMILLVQVDMRTEGRRHRHQLNDKQVKRHE
jgi:hypothetical protein